jgi:hypothetical protein
VTVLNTDLLLSQTPPAKPTHVSEMARLKVKAARAEIEIAKLKLEAVIAKNEFILNAIAVEFDIGSDDLVDDDTGAITRKA